MNICVFAGTFNPIHSGHIKMAEFALQKFQFEKIIFIPSYLPPHKDINKNLANHRINMVKMMTSYNKKFEVSDIEYKSNEISYSLITVKKFIEQYKLESRLNFIIGTDAFNKIESWYKAEELKSLVHFLVYPRRESDNIETLEELRAKGWDFELMNSDYFDISSTEIRNGRSIEDKEIKEYVAENGLYKI